jgi:hypothetical protein
MPRPTVQQMLVFFDTLKNKAKTTFPPRTASPSPSHRSTTSPPPQYSRSPFYRMAALIRQIKASPKLHWNRAELDSPMFDVLFPGYTLSHFRSLVVTHEPEFTFCAPDRLAVLVEAYTSRVCHFLKLHRHRLPIEFESFAKGIVTSVIHFKALSALRVTKPLPALRTKSCLPRPARCPRPKFKQTTRPGTSPATQVDPTPPSIAQKFKPEPVLCPNASAHSPQPIAYLGFVACPDYNVHMPKVPTTFHEPRPIFPDPDTLVAKLEAACTPVFPEYQPSQSRCPSVSPKPRSFLYEASGFSFTTPQSASNWRNRYQMPSYDFVNSTIHWTPAVDHVPHKSAVPSLMNTVPPSPVLPP